MAGLCNKCRSIEVLYRPEYRRVDKPVVIRQYDSLVDLKGLRAVSCLFCSLILRRVRSDYVDRIPEVLRKAEDPENLTKILCKYNQGQSNIDMQYSFRRGLQTTHFSLGGLYTHPDSPIAPFVSGRLISRDPGSEQTLGLVEEWIEDCEENHPTCSKEDAFLPTRIIDVGPEDGSKEPCLYVPPNGTKGRYLALSYCWGDISKDFSLTKATLEQRKHQIRLLGLPKTLQDAIEVTRGLGHSYLWVDSLCIMQDSQLEWQKQVSKMDGVFSGATMTIFASRARDSREGFLGDRPSHQDAPLLFRAPNGVTGKICIREEFPCHNEDKAPLSERAWAVQEQYLSRRCVFFHDGQTTFECRSATLAEGQSPYTSISLTNLEHRTETSSLVAGQAWAKKYKKTTDLRLCWREIVEDFSSRQLSVPSDRLPALQGLANQILKEFQDDDEYLFGMWKHQLPWLLLWNTLRENIPSSRPSVPCVPSWSWASVTGPVYHERFDKPEKVYCQLLSSSAAEGTLQLRGLIEKGVLLPSNLKKPNNTSHPFQGRLFIPIDGKAPIECKGTVRFDACTEMEEAIEGELWYLVVSRASGLVLSMSEKKGEFKRVGRYKVSKIATDEEKEGVNWGVRMKERTIVLV
ncbi:heterokaryon incompatibility protein-domain-containing protein [Amylocarpus encephaloides]|uniref:Heterokaryon incompatibility protein-domain-containing protein n=1 Tax=Amylocarpus encephaloides TaxID=45428 RepID=A0A9P7YLN7_9HELO|nr:heterokaryon incompatibility protein-domain-containing protein [Amylocarpus encephaloides]